MVAQHSNKWECPTRVSRVAAVLLVVTVVFVNSSCSIHDFIVGSARCGWDQSESGLDAQIREDPHLWVWAERAIEALDHLVCDLEITHRGLVLACEPRSAISSTMSLHADLSI